MTTPKRKLLKAYVKPEVHQRITAHAKRTKLSASRVVERLLETGKLPDRSTDLIIVNLLQVNADQARLGNLLLKGINETSDGHHVRQMQSLLKEVRETQVELKARVAELKP
ncbi:MAG: hypothetical protein K5905_00730 [Roseibium sp.]|uniref:hypothetical protein n=1 Tax=Roseibium sp. TaxID=1936156 RepID=UPI00262793D9|nr:hypothetical protein [Roseibium sp.]MCV0423972.1 hypothetical protein [Roseibium sp.]